MEHLVSRAGFEHRPRGTANYHSSRRAAQRNRPHIPTQVRRCYAIMQKRSGVSFRSEDKWGDAASADPRCRETFRALVSFSVSHEASITVRIESLVSPFKVGITEESKCGVQVYGRE